MQLLLLLIISVFASKEKETNTGNSQPNILEHSDHSSILVKVEKEEYIKTSSDYIGVTYHKQNEKWRAVRWSKEENKSVYKGTYEDEETAARASDTLARKLIANGEKGHKFNFPDDDNEVCAKTEKEIYFGVSYNGKYETWAAQRWSKSESKIVYNGASYKNEEMAAHASDTLARKLIANGEKGHKLNFPDDDTEVNPEKRNYIGANFQKRNLTWRAQRWSKEKNKTVHYGTNYKNEERAAHASDTLARKLIANGEKGHKLNFPDDDTEVYPKNQNNKRKRPADFENSQKCGQSLDKFE